MTGNVPPAPDAAGWGSRIGVALVALLVLCSVSVGQAVAAESNLSISNATLSTEQPAPGQLVEIRTTIENRGSGTSAIDVTDVFVRQRGSAEDLARAEDIGTVTGGGTLQVPLTVSFANPGVKKLRVSVVGQKPNGEFVNRKYPLTAVVSDRGPQVDIAVDDPVVGGETAVAVNVTNGNAENLRNVELHLEGSNVQIDNPRRIAAAIEGESDRTFTYTTTFEHSAETSLDATLQFQTVEGQTRTVSEQTTIVASRLAQSGDRPQIDLSVEDALPGATRSVNVTVANGLEHDVRQVRVVVGSSEANFSATERVRATIPAGQETTLRFPARVADAGSYPVNVTLVYTDEGARRRVSKTVSAAFDAPAQPGQVALTGTEAVYRAGTIEVSATAGNVGSTPVEGVIVSTSATRNVSGETYFVGEVEPSDFSSFTLQANARGPIDAITLRVQYVVDTVQQSFTMTLPVMQGQAPEPADSSGGGFPIVLVLVVGLLLVVGGVAYRRWR
jgi:hypothetical protein